jgi:uncharacterized protein (TIGR02246 family)
MRRSIRAVVAAFVVALPAIPAVARAQQAAPQGAPKRVVLPRAIASAWQKFATIIEQGDATGFAAMHTPDAIVFFEGSPDLRGRSEVQKFAADAFAKAKYSHVDVLPEEFTSFGELAYDIGRVSETVQREGQSPEPLAYRYLILWKRQREGGWLMHRVSVNALPPTK